MRKQSATPRRFPKAKRVSVVKEKKIAFPLSDKKEQNKLIHAVNMQLEGLKGYINNAEPKLPEFGSSLYAGDNVSCLYFQQATIVASVVADRITSKFECPNHGTEQLLRAQCTEDWISFERGHLEKFEFSNIPNTAEGRGVLYRAGTLIKKWLYDPKAQTDFYRALENAPIDFGPGESYEPSQGETHVFAKINSRSIFPFWTVTLDYAVHGSYLIAANKGLRQAAVEFLKSNRPSKYPAALDPNATLELQNIWNSSPHPRKISRRISALAERIFKEIFCAYPLHHPDCLIKMGSRGSSVYKNSKKRRFIEIQCLINVIGQKLGGYSIRSCLKTNAKIDLDDGQQYHRWLISQSWTSTLDESNASDSIVWSTVQPIFGAPLNNLISLTRADFIRLQVQEVTSNGRFQKKTEWHPIKKLSSMGNGYTFECLSLLLGAIARGRDPRSSVYGDDIVCSTDKADQIVADISAVGFLINHKKSFVGKPLKESCGGYYLDDYGYITCYDIKWCTSIADVIVTCNKLGRIIRENPLWDHPLKEAIKRTHAAILCEMPAFLRGPIGTTADIPVWVEDSRFLKSHKGSSFCKQKIQGYWGVTQHLNQHWQLFKPGSYPLAYSNEWAVCLIPEQKSVVSVRAQHSDVRSKALIWSYIHSGRVVDMQKRIQKEEYEWAFKPILVHSSGVFLRAGTARRVCAKYDPNGYKKEVIRDNIRFLKKKNKLKSLQLR